MTRPPRKRTQTEYEFRLFVRTESYEPAERVLDELRTALGKLILTESSPGSVPPGSTAPPFALYNAQITITPLSKTVRYL